MLYRLKFLFFQNWEIYRKIVLRMNAGKFVCSTLETWNQKINTEFDFLTPKLTLIEPKMDFK